VVALGAVLATVGLLSGCSSPPAPPSPYAQDFADARARAGSDFILSVLADDKIDTVELRQAQDHYTDCLAEAGVRAWYVDDGYGQSVLRMDSDENEQQLEADGRCYDLWMGRIGSLYWDQIANPDKQDWNSLVAACFVRHGLAPVGFSGRDFADLLLASAETITYVSEDGEVYTPEIPTLPPALSGISLFGPQENSCQSNPQL
jgi:hypothetical protein